ncbi:MAG: nucleotidyltransferase family protein [Pseudomonadota bacterium]
MNALLLCAGRGERLRPLTDSVPKPLVTVGGFPMIDHQLRALAAADIRRVVINLSWLGSAIRGRVGDGRDYGVEVVYSDEGAEALETGGAAVKAAELLGRDPFLLMNGDVFSDVALDAVCAMSLEDNDLAHVVVVNNPSHHPQGDFALTAGRLRGRTNGPAYTYAGIGLYRPAFFLGYPPRFSLAQPLFRYADAGRVSARLHDGVWFDMGSPERLSALEAFLTGARETQS